MSQAPFRARYVTTCLECHDEIAEGDWACYTPDGQVVHYDCRDPEDDYDTDDEDDEL